LLGESFLFGNPFSLLVQSRRAEESAQTFTTLQIDS
jgi:hypothetical protein